ncbi:tripartite tricarboxylate transporter substrate binding protein [Roseococcus microcysteis]|uniref:tripartite tricarboxylate transporter substrate binding protein n=1 Tax=Roseococcus microcysteis TaxID=2771361 RepID=UPI00168AE17B|nr:tripartite tricarboxylate transporter substrate binding protein [Roseococcus microcysteis]
MTRLHRRSLLSATAMGVLATPAIVPHASAQSWPSRPIELLIGFAAGGGTDILARTLAPFMEKHLGGGARIGVVNRPGPGGEIGFTQLAQARPDGHTIGMLNAPAFITIPHERRTRYTFESFEFVANLVSDPASINVHPSSEFQTIDQLVAWAKANPGRMTIGMQGTGSAMHLATLAFMRKVDIRATLVPFPGTAPNRTALLGRHIMASTFGIGEAAPFVKEGQIRNLGFMAANRWDELPDAKTMREQGIDVVAGSDRGLAVPAGTPTEIIERLSNAVTASLADPEFQVKAREQLLFLAPMPREEYRTYLTQLNEEIGRLWREDPWRR